MRGEEVPLLSILVPFEHVCCHVTRRSGTLVLQRETVRVCASLTTERMGSAEMEGHCMPLQVSDLNFSALV